MFCEKCGEKMHDSATYCEKCGHSMTPISHSGNRSTPLQGDPELPKKENFPLGILGALLGALLGCACIVGLYMADYVAAVSGIVLSFATFKGYELLGKQLSKKGIAVCILLMLVTPWLALRLSYTITLVQELGWDFMDTFLEMGELIELADVTDEYLKELGMVYLFTALGALYPLRSIFRKKG